MAFSWLNSRLQQRKQEIELRKQIRPTVKPEEALPHICPFCESPHWAEAPRLKWSAVEEAWLAVANCRHCKCVVTSRV
ncbi:hypothetical protein GG496_000977 [Candidatus Fervidibacteria bacterium JGI MDM2 JNZ-1-D12]